jgi:allantoicase
MVVKDQGPFTHIRLNIFPDGGVARLRYVSYLSRTMR